MLWTLVTKLKKLKTTKWNVTVIFSFPLRQLLGKTSVRVKCHKILHWNLQIIHMNNLSKRQIFKNYKGHYNQYIAHTVQTYRWVNFTSLRRQACHLLHFNMNMISSCTCYMVWCVAVRYLEQHIMLLKYIIVAFKIGKHLWDKLVSVITYVITDINACSITSLLFSFFWKTEDFPLVEKLLTKVSMNVILQNLLINRFTINNDVLLHNIFLFLALVYV